MLKKKMLAARRRRDRDREREVKPPGEFVPRPKVVERCDPEDLGFTGPREYARSLSTSRVCVKLDLGTNSANLQSFISYLIDEDEWAPQQSGVSIDEIALELSRIEPQSIVDASARVRDLEARRALVALTFGAQAALELARSRRSVSTQWREALKKAKEVLPREASRPAERRK